MITVQLREDEATTVAKSLEALVSDIRMELCDTDRADFRDGLKREKSALEHLIEQIERAQSAGG